MGSEPTDAMVEAAQDAWIKTRLKSAGNHKVAMRAALAAALSAQEEQIERLRELLMEARNSADVGLDLNCRIDAALEGSKRDA